MKIGLVCPYNIERNGGVVEVIFALKEGLIARGHIVKIITPNPRKGLNEESRDDVLYAGTSVDFRTLSFGYTTSQVSSTVDDEKIRAMLEEEKFDILHFHEPWIPLLSRQLLQVSDAVNIGTFHSRVSDSMMTRTVLKIVNPYLTSVLKYIDVLTAVSPSGASYVSGMSEKHIEIIPNGIDLKKYHDKDRSSNKSGPKTILFIGRLENRKGTKYLIQAFSLLQQDDPDVKLLIAGDGPDREKLELLVEDLKVKNVEFLGFISEEDKQRLLREVDLFCSPALFGESFGIVLLEAMASGAVTIAGNNPGYVDLMQGVGGLSILNPIDTDEFKRRLKLLLYQPEVRDLWQAWAKKYVKQFNYEHIIDQYEAFYVDSLAKHGKH